jgi:membrane protein
MREFALTCTRARAHYSSLKAVTPKPMPRVLRFVVRVASGLRAHDAFEAAASIAFWFFLSLVPLLVLVGFLVGQVARARGVDALVGPLLDVVPGTAEELVRKELERLAGASASSLAPLGVVGFLWTASSGLHNLMDVFEAGANVKRRQWWKQRVIALGWVVAGLATACLLAWLFVSVAAAVPAHDPVAPTPPAATVPPAPHGIDHLAVRSPAWSAHLRATAFKGRVHKALHTLREQVIVVVLLLAAGMGLLAGFYRFAVEHPAGVRRRVWPGTVAAVGSWLVVSWGFGEYAVSIADYTLYYGSLAAVAVLLVWLYLTSLTLVLGAEVNAQLERAR